jgi:acyl-CoA reductase-like NAD-dependent aldehyde dehydrogenase
MIQLLNTTPITIDNIPEVVRNLKLAFASGATKSYEWRIYQLKRLRDLFVENKEKLIQAVQKDLGKALPFEVTMSDYNLPLEGMNTIFRLIQY